jgi:sugar phosphate isomerase/epimerase
MKFGFVTGWNETNFQLAKEIGFDGVEIGVGGPLDPNTATDDDAKRAREMLDNLGIQALTLFTVGEYGHADAAVREQSWKNFRRTMEMAEIMGTDTVTTLAFVAHGVSPAEQLASYKESFSQFAKWAEDLGVKIGIENWPGGGNFAFSPANWTRMWEAVPSKAVGLEFDPSHLVWQGIDYIAALYEHADRVYAFHAKDTEINTYKLKKEGNLFPGWWRYRIPGWGDINWRRIFMAFNDFGYNGRVIIEHEDAIFYGDRWGEGLRLGLRELRSHIDPGTL